MGKFYDLIHKYRSNDNDIFVEIINEFDPLLNKYQRNGSYEDIKSDLTVFMFSLLSKIPLDNYDLKDDKNMISYIHKSLNHRYIYLNKKYSNVINKERDLEINYIGTYYDDSYNNVLLEDMSSCLTELEKNIINKIYILGFNETDISRMNNVTRQAINRTHKRALNKIKMEYLKIDNL